MFTFLDVLWLATHTQCQSREVLSEARSVVIILFHIFVVAVLQPSHVFASSNLAYKVGRGRLTGSWGLLEKDSAITDLGFGFTSCPYCCLCGDHYRDMTHEVRKWII